MAASSVGEGAGPSGAVSGHSPASRPKSTAGDGAPSPQTSTSSTRGRRARTSRASSHWAACVKISRLSEWATRYSSSAADDAGVDGDDDRAELRRAEPEVQELRAVGQQQGDRVAPADGQARQEVGGPVNLPVELAVRPGRDLPLQVVEDDEGRRGRRSRPAFKERPQRPGVGRQRRPSASRDRSAMRMLVIA